MTPPAAPPPRRPRRRSPRRSSQRRRRRPLRLRTPAASPGRLVIAAAPPLAPRRRARNAVPFTSARRGDGRGAGHGDRLGPGDSPAVSAPPAAPGQGTRSRRDAQTGKPVASSAPAPPGDSTPSPGWKGATLERLPAAAPPERDYRVVALDDLAARIGERVTIVTSGGKEIEGWSRRSTPRASCCACGARPAWPNWPLPRQRVHEVRIPPPRHD